MAKTAVKLKFNRAIDLLHHKGSRMVKMNTVQGTDWFILPKGGPISDADAARILARPDVCGQKDCLFPGLDQTYRIVKGPA